MSQITESALKTAQESPELNREAPVREATGLTPEELDRAVRRDSRRYDGGMTIY